MREAIQTEHLTRGFQNGEGEVFYAVKDISVRIPTGKLTILKGRSGSGKTTLLNLLSGLDEPTRGEVIFMGEPLFSKMPAERENLRRYQMGLIFQSIALVPVMTAYENIDFALRLAGYEKDRDKRIRELMAQVGLLGRMNHMPGQLSGGEQQRVAIARAVAHHPRVIFADEPTGALDTASGLAVMALLQNLVKEEHTTVIMTTHDTNLMEMGDVVFELRDGMIPKGTEEV